MSFSFEHKLTSHTFIIFCFIQFFFKSYLLLTIFFNRNP